MTAQEHVIAWIESSGPHYNRLLDLAASRKRNFSASYAATVATGIVADAYREMVRGGDAEPDYTAAELLQAASELAAWEAPE